MNNRVPVTIADMGKTITGKTPSSQYPSDFGDKFMFVTPTDNFDNKFITKTERHLSIVGLEKLKSKALPPYNLMITCIGSAMGKVSINKSTCVTNQQINSILIDRLKYSTDYVYYVLRNNYKKLRNASSGSTALPLLNKTDFNSLKLDVHIDLNVQKSIADVLSALDAKLDHNTRINSELESMVKTLYDYWFVQFDFPDKNGKPYKSSGGKMVWNVELKRDIPEGWEVLRLADVISRSATGLNPRDNFKLGQGDNYYITIRNVKNGKIIFDTNCDRVDDDALRIINERSDLRPGDILFTSIEPVGVTYFIHESPKNWNINESVFTLRPNRDRVSSEYLFMLLSSLEMKAFTNNVSAGSIHKGIRHGVLKTFKVSYGRKELIEDFSDYIRPILKRINLLDKENQRLSELRDWLLPMLMNGQVKVN